MVKYFFPIFYTIITLPYRLHVSIIIQIRWEDLYRIESLLSTMIVNWFSPLTKTEEMDGSYYNQKLEYVHLSMYCSYTLVRMYVRTYVCLCNYVHSPVVMC